MFQDSADEKERHVAQAGVAVAGEKRFVLFPERDVGVHARAVITEERLRHEGHRLVVLPRDVADDVFVILHVVAHDLERRETNIDFGLSRGGDLVMLAFDRDAGFLHLEAHFIADVLERVCRRDREITFLCPDLVAEVRKLFPAAIPMPFAAVDHVGGAVPVVVETHVVEDEKFRFRSEKRGVGDAGALQIRLGFFRHAARIAIVGLARDRLDDRTNETERWLGVKDIDPRARRIRDDEHVGCVDRFPAADTGAVKAEAFGENFLVILGQGGGEMLPGTGQIGELEVHEFDLVVLDHFADVGCSFFVVGHGWWLGVEALKS